VLVLLLTIPRQIDTRRCGVSGHRPVKQEARSGADEIDNNCRSRDGYAKFGGETDSRSFRCGVDPPLQTPRSLPPSAVWLDDVTEPHSTKRRRLNATSL